jgi:hypothetical protein
MPLAQMARPRLGRLSPPGTPTVRLNRRAQRADYATRLLSARICPLADSAVLTWRRETPNSDCFHAAMHPPARL